MTTINFKNVYVKSRATAVGPLEKDGPLGDLFDKSYDNNYCTETSFEKAERMLVYDAVDAALRKASLKVDDIGLLVGGDLINQLTSSHYFAKDLAVPFIGMYGACATSSLVIGQGALWVEHDMADNVVSFTSSHVATAERQRAWLGDGGLPRTRTCSERHREPSFPSARRSSCRP